MLESLITKLILEELEQLGNPESTASTKRTTDADIRNTVVQLIRLYKSVGLEKGIKTSKDSLLRLVTDVAKYRQVAEKGVGNRMEPKITQ